MLWYWWTPPTYVSLSGWLPYQWTAPITYSYGPSGTVHYNGTMVTVNNQSFTTNQYFDQVDSLATSVPEIDEDQAKKQEWLPLGVFSIVQYDVSDSTMMIQLAVTKNGVIAGTFFNEVTGVSHPVEGMVDKETQRAAWRSADGTNENVIMETGIFNLSEDETSVLVHFGPDERQTWKLVRLHAPEDELETENSSE